MAVYDDQDKKKYLEAALNGLEAEEKAYDEAQGEVLKRLGISEEEYHRTQ